ncbi:MAG: TatD family hydrolase [Lachnospiraceae bacterium]|nr:TatD family hydrolase [Lachnospiraceae bacterium]
MKIFDTHAHYDSRAFSEDREEVLSHIHNGFDVMGETVSVGRIVNNGADMASSYRSLLLAEEHDYIYAAVGVHPDSAGELIFCPEGCEVQDDEDNASAIVTDASKEIVSASVTADAGDMVNRKIIPEEECRKNRDDLRVLASKDKVVAIGEIGLDYHWDVWPREIQKKAFEWQWSLAEETGLPVIIHSRDAAEDTLRMVKGFYTKLMPGKDGTVNAALTSKTSSSVKAVMHCYSYSVEHAAEYLKLGLMFGIGGVVTFKNAKKLNEVVDMLPLDHILLETDCPYMAPDPFRGKRNNSGYLTYVAEKIAQIKGLDVKQVYDTTWDNACRFFSMDQ